MTNIDEATQIIRDLSDVDGETIGYAHAHNIASYLADAGLIMTELPKPWLHRPFDSYVWATTEPVIAACDRNVVVLGSYEWTPAQARELALALMAAANYTEEENE